ncbi:MAG: MarR family transcriptional regulator, partial [Massilia sp.]|nr:MarR family transcriptional regulator [Massilia sp.]
ASCSDADFEAIDQALCKLKQLIIDAGACPAAPSSTPLPKEEP